MEPDDELSPERADQLRDAVRTKYREVATRPAGHFPYPVGRDGAYALGYEETWLDVVPAASLDHFVGVGCPIRLRRPRPGEHVLDVGCGSGVDVFVASALVGVEGSATGIDLTPEMIDLARSACERWPFRTVSFDVGSAEALPYEDAAFDVVTSNGALNLVPAKDALFAELHRVLRPGGVLSVADLIVTDDVPLQTLSSIDAWST